MNTQPSGAHLQAVDLTTPLPRQTVHAARLTVIRHATSPADARQLLDALGLSDHKDTP